MYTEFDIYVIFRQSQSDFLNRPYRLPKDWNKYINSRMSEKNRLNLERITKYFNTKWETINIRKYFDCGFELFGKNFSYVRFFDKKIIKLYITRDKNKKREINFLKERLIKSGIFLKKKTNGDLNNYFKKDSFGTSKIVEDYINNNIDPNLFVYFLVKKYFKLADYERSIVPYIISNFNKIVEENRENWYFLSRLEEKICQ